jgi:hypothetical protein
MIGREPLAPLPVGAALNPVAPVELDPDFDVRWAAWITRGRVHEQRAQRRFVIGFSVVAIGAVIVYAFLR